MSSFNSVLFCFSEYIAEGRNKGLLLVFLIMVALISSQITFASNPWETGIDEKELNLLNYIQKFKDKAISKSRKGSIESYSLVSIVGSIVAYNIVCQKLRLLKYSEENVQMAREGIELASTIPYSQNLDRGCLITAMYGALINWGEGDIVKEDIKEEIQLHIYGQLEINSDSAVSWVEKLFPDIYCETVKDVMRESKHHSKNSLIGSLYKKYELGYEIDEGTGVFLKRAKSVGILDFIQNYKEFCGTNQSGSLSFYLHAGVIVRKIFLLEHSEENIQIAKDSIELLNDFPDFLKSNRDLITASFLVFLINFREFAIVKEYIKKTLMLSMSGVLILDSDSAVFWVNRNYPNLYSEAIKGITFKSKM